MAVLLRCGSQGLFHDSLFFSPAWARKGFGVSLWSASHAATWRSQHEVKAQRGGNGWNPIRSLGLGDIAGRNSVRVTGETGVRFRFAQFNRERNLAWLFFFFFHVSRAAPGLTSPPIGGKSPVDVQTGGSHCPVVPYDDNLLSRFASSV